jgi:CAAX protease family protein
MSEPPNPTPAPTEKQPFQPATISPIEVLTEPPRKRFAGEVLFFAGENLRPEWRALGYFVSVALTTYWVMWLGVSLFPEPVRGPAVLWREMYQEFAMLVGAMLPAIVIARFEGRSVGDYGLPPRQAFGRLFWLGAAWGLAAITVLLITLRAVHAFYFGPMVLHGVRILKFAVFWGTYFVMVGVFEEFLLRGYALYTLARGWGFWPAAVALSVLFGAIHLRNPGETWIGLLAVVAIGIFFCFTLYRTGSLWFAVGFHAFWDWGQTFLYAVPDSGTMEPGHLLRPSFQGPDWLTGGSVGPEASLVCFLVIAAVAGAFARGYRLPARGLSA